VAVVTPGPGSETGRKNPAIPVGEGRGGGPKGEGEKGVGAPSRIIHWKCPNPSLRMAKALCLVSHFM